MTGALGGGGGLATSWARRGGGHHRPIHHTRLRIPGNVLVLPGRGSTLLVQYDMTVWVLRFLTKSDLSNIAESCKKSRTTRLHSITCLPTHSGASPGGNAWKLSCTWSHVSGPWAPPPSTVLLQSLSAHTTQVAPGLPDLQGDRLSAEDRTHSTNSRLIQPRGTASLRSFAC